MVPQSLYPHAFFHTSCNKVGEGILEEETHSPGTW